MAYGILRVRKHKTIGSVARSSRHTFREQPTPNAAPSKLAQNRVVGARNTNQLLSNLRSLLPEKRRSDAVVCIEYLITASPEAFKRHGGYLSDLGDGYFQDAMLWLRERHGAENIISAAVHMDESTPHMVVYIVPFTKDGRLSCRDFLGGPKKLRQMQDDFYTACSSKRGLARGVVGSKAKHEDVAAFYSALKAIGSSPRLTKKDYVAKVMGIETDAWKLAVQVAEANSYGLELERRARKRKRSRDKSQERLSAKLDNESQILEHRKMLMAKKKAELDSFACLLIERERSVRKDEAKITLLEAKNAALERRLAGLEHRPLEMGSPKRKKQERSDQNVWQKSFE